MFRLRGGRHTQPILDIVSSSASDSCSLLSSVNQGSLPNVVVRPRICEAPSFSAIVRALAYTKHIAFHFKVETVWLRTVFALPLFVYRICPFERLRLRTIGPQLDFWNPQESRRRKGTSLVIAVVLSSHASCIHASCLW